MTPPAPSPASLPPWLTAYAPRSLPGHLNTSTYPPNGEHSLCALSTDCPLELCDFRPQNFLRQLSFPVSGLSPSNFLLTPISSSSICSYRGQSVFQSSPRPTMISLLQLVRGPRSSLGRCGQGERSLHCFSLSLWV